MFIVRTLLSTSVYSIQLLCPTLVNLQTEICNQANCKDVINCLNRPNYREDMIFESLCHIVGLGQITEFDDRLRRTDPKTGNSVEKTHRLWVLPLHSTVTATEQRRVFDLPEPGMRKVILSTNIAESSITVKDIKYGLWHLKNNTVMSEIGVIASMTLDQTFYRGFFRPYADVVNPGSSCYSDWLLPHQASLPRPRHKLHELTGAVGVQVEL